MRSISYLVLVFLLAGLHPGHRPEEELLEQGSPALAGFEIHPGFQIELVAAEPLVADPIDMEIDEKGRMYVLEFHSYPDNWTGVDRIKLLRDTDGDGVMDESTVFKDSLVQAMGIMRWKEGLLVTAPPAVIYLEDSDGDGRADVERSVLAGFHTRDGESDANNPTYGLDNGIYLANGPRSDGEIRFADRIDGPVIAVGATNRNVRFRPDTGELTARSGRSQYGLTFDRWGHPLFNSNRNHIYQEVIPTRYLERNPRLVVASATTSISDHGAAAQVFPVTANPEYQILTEVGEITSACGLVFYDGGLFPASFRDVSFTPEPAHNLIHADRLERAGPTLRAARILPTTEFLASEDAMFRPVNTYVGPDGALYVVDYHRQIIEGPEWIADEVLETRDIYEGTDMGRIYRITPLGTPAAVWTQGLDLGAAPDAELVAHLASENIWWRRHAQRLLVDRAAIGVVGELEALARGPSAVGRLHALWTLRGLGVLDPDRIREALRDPEPGVRENALVLAEAHLDALADDIVSMGTESDPTVRFQLLLTLGYIDTPQAAAVRRDLLFADIDDEWIQIAALSAPAVQEGDVLEAVLAEYQPSYASFVERLSTLAGAHRSGDRIGAMLRDATEGGASWQAPVLRGLARGIDGREDLDADVLVAAFFDHPEPAVQSAALEVLRATGLPPERTTAVDRARAILEDPAAPAGRRTQAITLLTLDDPARHATLFHRFIVPEEPSEVQAAAFRALGAVPATTVAQIALDRWPYLTREVRDAALDAILSRPFQLDRIELLLDGIEDGIVQPANLGWGDKVTLMRDIPEAMKQRGRALIEGVDAGIRRETAGYVRQVQLLTPVPADGRAVFFQTCARCHGLGEVAPGSDVGPDLMSVRGWTTPDLIDQIVQPSKAISRGYEIWQVELASGVTVEGMISSESANAVTLRDSTGRETTHARADIVGLRHLDASVMPGDFAESLTQQQMADLVAFIRVGQ